MHAICGNVSNDKESPMLHRPRPSRAERTRFRLFVTAAFLLSVLILRTIGCSDHIDGPQQETVSVLPCTNPCSLQIVIDRAEISSKFTDTARFLSAGTGERPYALGLGCYAVWDVELTRGEPGYDEALIAYLAFCDELLEWASPSGLWTYSEPFEWLQRQWQMEQHAGFIDDRTQSRVINHLLQAYRLSGNHVYLDAAATAGRTIIAVSPRLPLGNGFLFWSYINLGDARWKPSVASFNHNMSTLDAFLNLYYFSNDYTFLYAARQMLEGFSYISRGLLADDGRWNYGLSVSSGTSSDSVWVDSDWISGYQDLETGNVEQIQTRLDLLGYPRNDALDRVVSRHVAAQWTLPCSFRSCSQYLLRVDPAVWNDDSFSFQLRGEEFPLFPLPPALSGPGFISQFGPITLFRGYTTVELFFTIDLDPAIIYSLAQGEGFSLLTAARVKRVQAAGRGYYFLTVDRLDSCRDGYILIAAGRTVKSLDPAVTLRESASGARGTLYRFAVNGPGECVMGLHVE